MRVVDRLRRTRYGLTSFFAGRNEEEACLETARSARCYSRNTIAVLDDKLAFSAALMRAGEVRAAYRMMEEAEADVLREESTLRERVDRVAAAGSTPRARMTRLRLARVLATACLMGGSIVGVAVAGAIVDRLAPGDARAEVPAGSAPRSDTPATKLREVELAPGVKVTLNRSQLRTFRAIRNGRAVTHHEAELFLASLRPNDVGVFLTTLPSERVTAFLAHLPSELVYELTKRYGITATTGGELAAFVKAKAKEKPTQAEAEDGESESEADDADAGEPAEAPDEADPQPGDDDSKANDGGPGRPQDKGEAKIELPELTLP
ncbi:MAG: hypothetical protein ACRDJV_00920 [Actinomycetota bacterium]